MSNRTLITETAAFQGNRGAYSESAANKFFGDNINCNPCHTFDNVFDSVISGESTSGVIPIENSFTGPIYQNYDLLLKHDLWIMGENFVRVRHNLIAHPGTRFEDIKRVYSHPQGLGQCVKFLAENPRLEQIPAYDTAGSVDMIKKNSWKDAAAIAGKKAAEFYGMEILKSGIEDIEENYTRFLIIRLNREISDKANKTSIVFSVKNTPGALFKCLSVFALRDIGLSRIESRPLRGKPWQYFFYLDLEDNVNNERCKNAINHLQEITTFFKILGCYPQGLDNNS